MTFAGWRGASGKPHAPDSGAFFLSYQAVALLVAGLLFTALKCTRERAVIALSLLTPVSALLFAALPNLASFRPTLEWIDFAVWTTALVISLTMLASALRRRNRRSLCESS
jgi:peptidoglycan/LPS O-acetylase OafA/YrhL